LKAKEDPEWEGKVAQWVADVMPEENINIENLFDSLKVWLFSEWKCRGDREK